MIFRKALLNVLLFCCTLKICSSGFCVNLLMFIEFFSCVIMLMFVEVFFGLFSSYAHLSCADEEPRWN